MFIGYWVIFGIRVLSLEFIVKFVPNHRVYKTLKKKVNFFFYYIASTKGAMPIILRSLFVSAYFYH